MTFWESGDSLAHTALSGVLAYAAVVLFLRISGKRTLAKMNAFDLVVTVALGSTLATLVTSQRLALANGILALGLLILLQFAVAWLSVRVKWFRRVVKSEPALLLKDGELLEEGMRRARVARDEICAAARAAGEHDLATISAIVLETDGSFSVIPTAARIPRQSTLADVRHPGQLR